MTIHILSSVAWALSSSAVTSLAIVSSSRMSEGGKECGMEENTGIKAHQKVSHPARLLSFSRVKRDVRKITLTQFFPDQGLYRVSSKRESQEIIQAWTTECLQGLVLGWPQKLLYSKPFKRGPSTVFVDLPLPPVRNESMIGHVSRQRRVGT